jgi:hypothetical protein
MKRFGIIILALTLISSHLTAQEEIQKKERPYFFGGNFGLAFGDITMVEVAPHAGYYFTPRFYSGAGLKYHYYKEKRQVILGLSSSDYSTNVYGGQLFSGYELIRDFGKYTPSLKNMGLYLEAQYELLNMKERSALNNTNGRYTLNNFFLGGGIRQWFNSYSSVFISLMYNFNYDENKSPYSSNPVLQIGINF